MPKPNNNNNKPVRTKPVQMNLPFIVTGKDQHGNSYVNTLIEDLQSAGTFDKLSVMATVAKKVVLNKEDARGVMSVARVQSYNAENGEIDLLFFGKNAEYATACSGMAVVPRVRYERDSKKVTTIIAFEIVDMMEA